MTISQQGEIADCSRILMQFAPDHNLQAVDQHLGLQVEIHAVKIWRRLRARGKELFIEQMSQPLSRTRKDCV
jgi:hypothetical protein